MVNQRSFIVKSVHQPGVLSVMISGTSTHDEDVIVLRYENSVNTALTLCYSVRYCTVAVIVLCPLLDCG